MTVPAQTVQTFAMEGIREDLSDTITNIAPYETPCYSMARKGKTKSRTPEWQRDKYRDADGDNKTVEGSDVEGDATGQPERLKNVVQLVDETVVVSTTAQAVDTAGRKSEMGYQVAKASKALKTDVETRMTGNYASVLGAANTPGEMGGAEAWIETNVDIAGDGAVGGFNPGTGLIEAATDGTQRDIAEDQLKTVVAKCWARGGEPSVIMVGGSNKQAISSNFGGIATQYRENQGTKRATILGAADIYISDFGEHKVIPNRFQRDRTALVLTPSTWEMKFLQPWKTEPLAKTGHNIKRLLSAELSCCVTEERANGKISDLNFVDLLA